MQSVFEDLYNKNKYVVKIYTDDSDWTIYMFQNKHIQLDIQTPNLLTSSYIDIPTVIDYIESHNGSIKIKYTFYYDGYESYKAMMEAVINKIKVHYTEKCIIVKNKFYYH
jgi:hypothetical protein